METSVCYRRLAGLVVLSFLILSNIAHAFDYRPPFSEFSTTFPSKPEVNQVKQHIATASASVETVVADLVMKDGYLKAEYVPINDSQYLKSMTRAGAIETLENYAQAYAIAGASFSAEKRGGYWVAEGKGLKQMTLGNGSRINAVYKLIGYYGKRSILIQHAIGDVKEFPTPTVMNFLRVRVQNDRK